MANAYNIPSVTASSAIEQLTELYSTAYQSSMLAEIPSVALWGPMGVGKSTMVKKVAAQMSEKLGMKIGNRYSSAELFADRSAWYSNCRRGERIYSLAEAEDL